MAIMNTTVPGQGMYTEYTNSFRRQKPIPTDYYEVFYSTEDAINYAKSDGTAYVGQKIVVVEIEKNAVKSVTQYLIGDKAGTLIEVCDVNKSYVFDGGNAQDAINETI